MVLFLLWTYFTVPVLFLENHLINIASSDLNYSSDCMYIKVHHFPRY